MATHILKLKTHTCKNNIAFKTNTWEKYSLLVLRGLIDSINFLWQIGPECSNKKRTCGFSSGVYSPPHESEQNRKLCRIYNELIQQHICFSSLWPRPREHTHTHTCTHAHTDSSSTRSSSLTEQQTHFFGCWSSCTMSCMLDCRWNSCADCFLLLFCIRTKFILRFEYTNTTL